MAVDDTLVPPKVTLALIFVFEPLTVKFAPESVVLDVITVFVPPSEVFDEKCVFVPDAFKLAPVKVAFDETIVLVPPSVLFEVIFKLEPKI